MKIIKHLKEVGENLMPLGHLATFIITLNIIMLLYTYFK